MYDDCQEFLDAAKDAGEDDLEDATCDGKNIIMAISYSELCDDTEDEETCEVASAGLWGTIILWVAVAAGLGATLLIIFNTFGIDALPVNTQQFGMITGIAAGALAGIGVLVWYILLPSDTDDMNAGLNVWLTIVGAVTGIAGGVLTKTHGNPSA